MNSSKHQIRLYADSLGLPRPGVVNYDERYFSLFLNWFREQAKSETEIVDHSRSNTTIKDLCAWFSEDNRYYGDKADVIILQNGIVDCAPRPIPRKVRNIISKLPNFLRKHVIKFLHNHRSKLQNLGLKYFLVKPDDFLEEYKKFLTLASKVAKRVYVFNIVPTNDAVETQSPGLKKSISDYNELITRSIKETGFENVHLLDVNKFVESNIKNLDDYVLKEDGHHITKLSHRIYADMIIEIEKKYLP